MAAFKAIDPHVVPTRARLLSGPLRWWSVPETMERQSAVLSLLHQCVGDARSGDSGWRQERRLPRSSERQRLGGVTERDVDIVEACAADGLTTATAMAAFSAENHGVLPTEARLLSRKSPGPYLEDWAHNPPNYAYRIVAGRLEVAIPATGSWTVYTGPTSCARLVKL